MRVLVTSSIAVVLFLIIQNGLTFIFVDILEGIILNDFLLVISLSELISYVIVLVLAIFFYRKNRRSFKFTGEDNNIYNLLSIVLLVLSIYFIIESLSSFWQSNDIDKAMGASKEPVSFFIMLLVFITVVLLSPIIEELLFRGIILSNVFDRHGALKSVLFTSVLYMLVHVDFIGINYYYLGSVLFMGILYGILLLKYGLLYSILAHVIYNLIWYASKYFDVPSSLQDFMGKSYMYVVIIIILISATVSLSIKVFRKSYLKLICS